MVKNLETGKSNEKKYKLIQDVLDKRNQELKDLYVQGDYIVKPEYLEWQIFFNTFYSSHKSGGKKDKIIPYSENEIKSVEFGMSLPIKKIEKEEINLNISPIEIPKMSTVISGVNPINIAAPAFNFENFSPVLVPATREYYLGRLGAGDNIPIGIVTNAVKYDTTTGNNIYQNLNVTAGPSGTKFLVKPTQMDITGTTTYANGAYTGTTPASYTLNYSAYPTAITIGNNGNYEIKGDWDYEVFGYKYHSNFGFLSYRPTYVNSDSKVVFDGSLILRNGSMSGGGYALVGLSLSPSSQILRPSTKVVLENKGIITIANSNSNYDTNVIGMQLENADNPYIFENVELINSGTIDIETTKSPNFYGKATGMQINLHSSSDYIPTAHIIVGNINIRGTGGSALYGLIFGDTNRTGLVDSKITVDGSGGSINLEAAYAVGMQINRINKPQAAANGLENFKNLSIIINGQNQVGMSRKTNETNENAVEMIVTKDVLNNIEFAENSKGSVMFYPMRGVLTLDANLASSVGTINMGTGNAIAFLYNTEFPTQPFNYSTIRNYMPVNIGAGATAMTAFAVRTSGTIENYADIVNDSLSYIDGGTGYEYGANGLISSLAESKTINTGSIDMNGPRATALFNGNIMDSKSDHIIINNDRGIGAYSTFNTIGTYPNYTRLNAKTDISANKFEINGDNGVVAFSDGGHITLSPLVTGGTMEMKANGKNTYAFYHRVAQLNISGKITVNGTVNANIENGGIGINYNGTGITGTPVNIKNELSNIIDSTNGNLNFISNSDSYNIALTNTTFNLSDLSNLNFNNVTFTQNGNSKVYNSSLYLDIDSNIDENNNTGDKTYRNIESALTDITINSGVTVSGSEDNLTGIKQGSSEWERTTQLINNGVISLTGKSSDGIYGKRASLIENTWKIDVLGAGSIGVFGTSSIINNTGEINIGDKGIGIYGETYLDPSDNSALYSSSKITNNGKITAGIGTNAVGIYGNENADAGATGVQEIILGVNSDIDMRNSEKGIGIYVDKSSINSTNSGIISVGKSGYGLYINDESAVLDDLTLNLSGDNSVGIYTNGTASFTGSGTVNIDGKGIVVFNIDSTGIYNQNFNFIPTQNSTYTVQNVKNRSITSDNTINLKGSSATYINSLDSTIILDVNSNIKSFNTVTNSYDSNMIGVVSTGPLGNVTNKGIISFGDNSAGLYMSIGGYALNEGSIEVGGNSAGMYGNGAGTNLKNTGNISVEDNSVAMLLEDGDNLENTGILASSEERAIGIYSDSANNTTLTNINNIDMSGDRTIGVYLSGTGSQLLSNSGIIKVRDSNSNSDPSVAIYNNGSNKMINTGSIEAGENSIGVYNKGGEVIQNAGNLELGKNGVGVYTDSGKVTLNSGIVNFNGESGVGIYGINGAQIENSSVFNLTDESYGVVLNSGSSLVNNSSMIIGNMGVFTYSDGGSNILNNLGADIVMTGSNSVGFYTENGTNIENHGNITGNSGAANIGIFNSKGSIINTGDIKLGDSIIIDKEKPLLNSYSVGVYGDGVTGFRNSGNIETGSNAVGLYVKDNIGVALNTGNISSVKDGVIGIYAENGSIKNTGNITLSGKDSIGIAAARKVTAVNSGVITMNGDDSVGIYADISSKVINESTGIININGNNSIGIQLLAGSTLENYGQINLATGAIGSSDIISGEDGYKLPSIINAGIIKVDEKFEIKGVDLTIKVDPSSLRVPTPEEIITENYDLKDIDGGFLITNSVSIKAPEFDLNGRTTNIDPSFTQGTNLRVYKFENVFDPTTPEGGPNNGEVAVKSGSLTFDAIPVINNSTGSVDIWMEKIDYNKFNKGAWYSEFSGNIETKYLNAQGDALKLYDKLDLVQTEEELGNNFEQLAGNMYSNIMKREQNIAEAFNNTLEILGNSENNTKENVKIGIIAGKGDSKEDTSGVLDYDYNVSGVLGLREIERTYRHKFGYSLGYTRTDFQMDGTNDEDQANTIQLGLHNTYSVNGWNMKNDLLGRVSFHDVDRSVNWSDGTMSKLNSDYNVYGVSSLNELGKDLEVSKNIKLVPYVGLELGYAVHSSFEEKGSSESLKVESNDSYSVKPNIGVRLEGEKEFGATSSWKVKGNVGVGYGYELGNMNNQEKASLSIIEDGYHNLAKPVEDKGEIKTSGYIGVELKETYGVYVTGEYGIGNDNKEDYKAGIALKASF